MEQGKQAGFDYTETSARIYRGDVARLKRIRRRLESDLPEDRSMALPEVIHWAIGQAESGTGEQR